jgi:tetratricopeptide (TPR) repeat protein
MPGTTPVRRAATVAAALALAAVTGVVGYLASGPHPRTPERAEGPAPAPPAPAPASDPKSAADEVRVAKVRAGLEAKLAEEEDPHILALEARLKENPADVDALLSIGYLYVQRREYSKARGYYMRAAQVAPGNVEARTHLGSVAYFLGHLDEALHHYEQALALDPDYAPAYFEMGAALRFGRGDLQGAIDAWERFLVLDPQAEEADRIRELIAEARRMLAEGTAPNVRHPAEPGPVPEPVPIDPESAPWPGQGGADRSRAPDLGAAVPGSAG